MSEGFFDSEIVASESHIRYIPVMIARLLLSLKKAGSLQEEGWSLGEPTTYASMMFAGRRGDLTTRDEMHLVTFPSMHESVYGQP